MTTPPTTTGTAAGEVQREHIDVYLMHFAADATNWEHEMLAEITRYIDDKDRELAASREREARLRECVQRYANDENWRDEGWAWCNPLDAPVSCLGAEVAQQCLAALAETEEPR